MRPRNIITFLTVLSILAMLALATTVEAADKKKQRNDNKQGVKRVVRYDNDDNRKVVKERRISKPAGGPKKNVFEKTVTRRDPNENRKVELNRKIVQNGDKPVRNVFDKTVTRTTEVGHGKLRTVTLNKTFTNVDGERKDVDFDRKVTYTNTRKSRGHDDHKQDYRRHDDDDKKWHGSSSVHYGHGHSRHVCGSSCQYYSPPSTRGFSHYPHGHSSHVCHNGCSHYKSSSSGFSIGISYGDGYSSGSIYYGQSRGYTPCHRCGAGYYKRVWVPARCVTYYDSCGRRYSRYVGGYYTKEWCEHTCH